ncbi:MAG: hypothetical protein M5U28_02950 [Sandaracinaceae bacterium]|nr:hypothetical protein [Sandaracinaceae bacterium]
MPRDPNLPPAEDDEFFVGYFPTPAPLARFALGVAFVVLLAGGGVAFAAAYLQRPPGEAHEREAQLEGLVVAEPYGMVRYLDGERVRHVLLVRGGKRGAPRRDVERLADRAATVSGLLLEREGRQLLELHAGMREAELDEATVARLRDVPREELGEVTIEGEIVDSKCYLGRMRPGGGRTHRACAQLCIAGNIPPLLVARDASGRAAHYLLASTQNRSIATEVLPYVAEPVRVTGRLTRVSDLLVLRVDPSAIERL